MELISSKGENFFKFYRISVKNFRTLDENSTNLDKSMDGFIGRFKLTRLKKVGTFGLNIASLWESIQRNTNPS